MLRGSRLSRVAVCAAAPAVGPSAEEQAAMQRSHHPGMVSCAIAPECPASLHALWSVLSLGVCLMWCVACSRLFTAVLLPRVRPVEASRAEAWQQVLFLSQQRAPTVNRGAFDHRPTRPVGSERIAADGFSSCALPPSRPSPLRPQPTHPLHNSRNTAALRAFHHP